MAAVEVTTQAQLDKALRDLKPDDWVVCLGGTRYKPLTVRGSAHVEARGSAHVEAWESAHVVARGSAHVEAWESAHVVARGSAHVVAWESAHVEARESAHVEAWESAHVVARGSAHVVAWESSHVVAWESSHVEARESSHVVATPYVAVTKQIGHCGSLAGGVIIEIPKIETASDWLVFHGLTAKRGVVTLYKAVDDAFVSSRSFAYTPGTKPACTDWNARPVCGGGLHFTAHPLISKDYKPDATRYVACPIRVSELVVIDNEKVKAPRVAGRIVEVDADRNPVAAEGAKAA